MKKPNRAPPEVRFLRLSADEVYATAEVLGRVTQRQLRAMGLTLAERAACDRVHEAMVAILQEDAKADPRQLVLRLHPSE